MKDILDDKKRRNISYIKQDMGLIKLFSIVLVKRKKYAVCIITNAINREKYMLE